MRTQRTPPPVERSALALLVQTLSLKTGSSAERLVTLARATHLAGFGGLGAQRIAGVAPKTPVRVPNFGELEVWAATFLARAVDNMAFPSSLSIRERDYLRDQARKP